MRIDDLVHMTQQLQGKYSRPSALYPKKWNNMRWAIFSSVGFRCALCKKYAKGNLCLHHIRPISISHDNSPKNLQVLCRDCHNLVHKKYIDMIKNDEKL